MAQAVITGSTVPRRQLGRFLREARGNARLTVRAAARALEWSEAKMWRVETGQVAMRTHDVETMCRVYGVAPGLTEALKGLAQETRTRGWWHAYGEAIPAWFNVFVGLEEAADHIDTYQPELVPGLFQTADYARALLRARFPAQSVEEIEQRVLLRMSRQSLVSRPVDPPRLTVVLNEAVLLRPIGGRLVMAAQCRHLEELAGRTPHVTLRVVPFDSGVHAGLTTGAFVLLRFPTDGEGRATEPPTVYVEGMTGALYLEQPHEVDSYRQAFEDLLATLGDADGQRSRALIHHATKEHAQ